MSRQVHQRANDTLTKNGGRDYAPLIEEAVKFESLEGQRRKLLKQHCSSSREITPDP
jgi:hypothetical protein